MNQVQTNLIFFSNIQYIPITEKLTESRINIAGTRRRSKYTQSLEGAELTCTAVLCLFLYRRDLKMNPSYSNVQPEMIGYTC